MGLFSALRPKPAEVRACLAELEMLEADLRQRLLIVPDELFASVKLELLDEQRTVHTILVDKVAPRNVVLLVLSNVAGELLGSGRYHVYRGTLAMPGQGLLQLFHFAVDELARSGFHDAATAAEDRSWVARQIRDAG